jgi:hypothetical protein
MKKEKPKYHNGDKVVVIPYLDPNQYNKYVFNSKMSKLLGETVTIKGSALHDKTYGYYYNIKDSSGCWLESLFVGLEKEVPFDESEYNSLMSF